MERREQEIKAKEEAEIERELRALRPDAGYQDPALPRLMQGETGYRLPEGERKRLRDLKEELDELEAGAEAWRGTKVPLSVPKGQERIAELKAEIEKVEAEHERLRAGGTLDVGEIAPGPIEAKQTRRSEEARAQSEEAMAMLASRYGVSRGGGELTYDPVEVLKVFTDAGTQMDENLLDQVFQLAPNDRDLLQAAAAEKQRLKGLRQMLEEDVLLEAAAPGLEQPLIATTGAPVGATAYMKAGDAKQYEEIKSSGGIFTGIQRQSYPPQYGYVQPGDEGYEVAQKNEQLGRGFDPGPEFQESELVPLNQ